MSLRKIDVADRGPIKEMHHPHGTHGRSRSHAA
ncbi:hypothetical protein Ae168Ps1_1602 [Pseudonocardia sp. Ae168_Ps1]|nr:hypothetical protein Ae150APs1_1597 [Pseudonocardia sp. Ae150A_Ps1]OLL79196.1 hypothetical protein Ae168Ps1_1602 [Pseudonocardia sp. Ae168_Ps1]OLL86667.1 hypothetical protein Ae263Ps1_3722c [Pseudonocardia sp. Ae263_Ps1]OLL93287.1 hypothetical protein Ae356Ps1_3184 [Pseudonocardia sp. Ae356_Ps1]